MLEATFRWNFLRNYDFHVETNFLKGWPKELEPWPSACYYTMLILYKKSETRTERHLSRELVLKNKYRDSFEGVGLVKRVCIAYWYWNHIIGMGRETQFYIEIDTKIINFRNRNEKQRGSVTTCRKTMALSAFNKKWFRKQNDCNLSSSTWCALKSFEFWITK